MQTKISLSYVQSFQHNTGVWQTDRRTVGRTPHNSIYGATQCVARIKLSTQQ